MPARYGSIVRLLFLGLLLAAAPGWGPARAQLSLLQTIPLHDLENGEEPWGVAASSVDPRVYVACIGGPHELMVLDAVGDSIVGGASLTGPYPHGVAVNEAGDRVYVASSGGSVSIIDAHTLAETHVAALAGTPMDLCLFEPDTGLPLVYVVDKSGAQVWVLDASDGDLLRTIDVGNYPYDICAIEEAGRVYAANLSDWTVSVIDATADTVVATIPVGAYPEGIACDPELNRIYTANRDDNSVSVIDGATNTVIATHPVGAKPRKLAVDPVSHRVYVANSEDNSVTVLDPDGPVTPPAPAGLSPYGGICVDPLRARVFVSNIDSDDVTAFNTAAPWETATIRLRSHPRSVALAGPWGPDLSGRAGVLAANGFGNDIAQVDPDGPGITRRLLAGYAPEDVAARRADGLVAAAVGGRDELLLFDGETGAATDTVSVGDSPYGLAIGEERNRIYVTNQQSCDLSVYDVDSARVIDTIELTDGWVANDVALNEPAGEIYATTWWAWLWFLDAATHEMIDRLTLHGFCEINQLAVDPMRQLIYVAALNCPTLWIVDAKTHHVLEDIGLPGYPGGVAVNPMLQQAYVTADDWLVSIGPEHSIADQLRLPGTALRCVADPACQRVYVSGDEDGRGVLYEVIDGDPSGLRDGGPGGPPTAEWRGPRLRLASPQPAVLGTPGGRPAVQLTLELDCPAVVEAGVYDVCGRLVGRIARQKDAGFWSAGSHRLHWNGMADGDRPVSPGVYYIRARIRSSEGQRSQAAASVVMID